MQEAAALHAGRKPTELACLQEPGRPLLQGALAHAGLLGTGAAEGTSRSRYANANANVSVAAKVKPLLCVRS